MFFIKKMGFLVKDLDGIGKGEGLKNCMCVLQNRQKVILVFIKLFLW